MNKNFFLPVLSLIIIASGVFIISSLHTSSTITPIHQTAAVADFDNALVAHWTFDEGSGTTAADASGKGHAITLNSAVAWDVGQHGSAISFHNANAAAYSPDEIIGVGDVTVSAWIKASSIPFLGVIISNNSNGFSVRVAKNFMRLECSNGGSQTAYSANQSLSVNEWLMVVAVRKVDGTCTLYVNGVQSGTADQPAGTIIAGNSGTYIGRRPAAAYPFDGSIDDVRIYNRALLSDEVLTIYTDAGGAPPPVYHTLSVITSGSGIVTSSPTGIACGATESTCSLSAKEHTTYTLTASARPGSTFDGWSGACSGTDPCTISLDGDISVTATFTADNPPQVSGNTVTAHSCSQIDVQAAIDAAQDGWTVDVPAGNCSWTPLGSAGAAVLMTKSLTLKGAGMGMTNIILTDAPGYNQEALAVNISQDKSFRVSGFTFHGDGLFTYILVYGLSRSFRIDHVNNVADTPRPPRLITISGYTYGVIDHIRAEAGSSGYGGTVLVRDEDAVARLSGNTAWLRPLTLGTDQAVYIENSVFVGGQSGFSGFAVDIENGGRVVFRRNMVINLEFGGHGAQSSGGRGEFSWEVYDNVFTVDYQVWIVSTWFRGGTGVVFNNIYNITGGGYGYSLAVDNPRSHTAYVTFGSKCDGTNTWDGNEDATGYPCADQVGRSTGDPKHQLLVPVYEWNNVTNDGKDVNIVVINPPSDQHIKLGRDFFNNTCKPGYTPYTYPHPLVQQQDGVSAQPVSLNCPGSPVVASGVCSDSLNTCTTGSFADVADTSTSYQWSCTGFNGGTTAQCSLPITNPANPTSTADFNSDGHVNSLDFSLLQGSWNRSSTIYDLNKDGIVNSLDYSILIQQWTG